MQEKYLETLEFFKVLELLAEHTSFSASKELALNLRPSTDPVEIERWQRETGEACSLLNAQGDIAMGGVYDVRPLVRNALKGLILTPEELLNIRDTLVTGRTLKRYLSRLAAEYPLLAKTALLIEECAHVAAEVSRCIDERAEIVDAASPELARIRKELGVVQERLMERLRRFLTSAEYSGYLQEQIITQRHGRYVIPLKADFKGRIPGLIHDESGSGATLFIEPLATVEINNALRELQMDEQREVSRILGKLSSLVADEADFINRTVEVLAGLDLTFAKARYALQIRAEPPTLVAWETPHLGRKRTHREVSGENVALHPGSIIRLHRARHPLIPAEKVVPIDVHLSPADGFFIIIITGPNTGGKTVSLKTVGLLVSMAQAGLHIPVAEGSTLSVFNAVFADIGDEQSIEQNLSTFSSHMGNLIDILEQADERSLVLLDELGAGTDPVEGSALARAILSSLLRRGVTTLATTHYSDLKVYAHTMPGVVNASVEFDIETLSPTYELSIGLPGRSNAFAIAQRLGLDPAIIEEAQASLSPDTLEAEGLLAELKEIHRRSAADMAVAHESRKKLEGQTEELRRRLLEIDDERQRILQEAHQQAQQELEGIRKEIARARNSLRRFPDTEISTETSEARPVQDIAAAEAVVAGLKERVHGLRRQSRLQDAPEEPIAEGDMVWVPGLNSKGEIISLSDQSAEVQVGQFRVQVDRNTLRRTTEAVARPVAPRDQSVRITTRRPIQPAMELDLRGWRVEDALMRLERYLDDAYLSALPWVRIIHGRGTGALRKAVRETLSMHPLVSSFRSGGIDEGGDGVTLVEMVKK